MNSKHKNLRLLIPVLLLGLIIQTSCLKTKTPSLITEDPRLQETRAFWQQQTIQARLLQTQGTRNPQGILPIITPKTSTPVSQQTPALEPSATKTPDDRPSQPSATQTVESSTTPPDITSTQTPSRTSTRTSTSSQPVQPTSARTKTPTQIYTPTRTQTPSPTETHTPVNSATLTLTLQTGWGGTWMAFREQEDGSYKSGLLTVSLTNENLIGEIIATGESLIFTGEIEGILNIVFGSWENGSLSGNFYWKYISHDQFRGNMGNGLAICAARNGAPKPDPCFYSPED